MSVAPAYLRKSHPWTIVSQYALFSLMSRADVSPDQWLLQRPQTARRLVMPAEVKWLVPALDGLSRWDARYYVRRR